MLVATFAVSSISNTQKQLGQCMSSVDAIELRLDYLKKSWDMIELSALRKACSLPVIITLRSVSQGGYYAFSETKRLEDILELCSLDPDYLDLEYTVPAQFIRKIRNDYPEIRLILSYHNFNATPENLWLIFQDIYQPDCYAYKIATYAQSTLDSLRMLQFVKNTSCDHHIIGLCMGELGSCTRVLGIVMGGLLTYAPWDEYQVTAPGQLSLSDLTMLYCYRTLNKEVQIYALLGDEIILDAGHILHNIVLKILEKNVIYELWVDKEELPVILSIMHQLKIFFRDPFKDANTILDQYLGN